MARYIDAELVKAEFTGNFIEEYPTGLIKAIIGGVPTADVQEVKHGKWIDKGRGYGWYKECSNCSYRNDYPMEDFKYCPNCGAKMDEMENEK